MLALAMASVSSRFKFKDLLGIDSKIVPIVFILIFAGLVYYHIFYLNQKIKELKVSIDSKYIRDDSLTILSMGDLLNLRTMGQRRWSILIYG